MTSVSISDSTIFAGKDVLFSAHVTVSSDTPLSATTMFGFSLPISNDEKYASYTNPVCYMYQHGKTPEVKKTDVVSIDTVREDEMVTLIIETPLIELDKDFTVGCTATAAELPADAESATYDSFFTISGANLMNTKFTTTFRQDRVADSVSLKRDHHLTLVLDGISNELAEVRVFAIDNVTISDFLPTTCSIQHNDRERQEITVSKNLDEHYLSFPTELPEGIEVTRVELLCDFAMSPIYVNPTVWEYPSMFLVRGVNQNSDVLGESNVIGSFERNDEDDVSTAVTFGTAVVAASMVASFLAFFL